MICSLRKNNSNQFAKKVVNFINIKNVFKTRKNLMLRNKLKNNNKMMLKEPKVSLLRFQWVPLSFSMNASKSMKHWLNYNAFDCEDVNIIIPWLRCRQCVVQPWLWDVQQSMEMYVKESWSLRNRRIRTSRTAQKNRLNCIHMWPYL